MIDTIKDTKIALLASNLYKIENMYIKMAPRELAKVRTKIATKISEVLIRRPTENQEKLPSTKKVRANLYPINDRKICWYCGNRCCT